MKIIVDIKPKVIKTVGEGVLRFSAENDPNYGKFITLRIYYLSFAYNF